MFQNNSNGKNNNTLFSSIYSIHLACKIIGFNPFTISPKRNKLLHTKRDLYLNILHFVVFFTFILTDIFVFKPMLNAFNLIKFVIYFITCINLISCRLNRQNVFNIFEDFQSVDRAMNLITIEFNYYQIARHNNRLISCAFYFIFLIIFSYFYYGLEKYLQMILVITIFYYHIVLQLFMFALLYIMRLKYRVLNTKLKGVLRSENISSVDLNNISVFNVLQKIVEIHGFLGTICDKINNLFHVNLLLNLLVYFFCTIFAAYKLVMCIFQTNYTVDIILLLLFWSLVFLAFTALTIYYFLSVSKQVNNIFY